MPDRCAFCVTWLYGNHRCLLWLDGGKCLHLCRKCYRAAAE